MAGGAQPGEPGSATEIEAAGRDMARAAAEVACIAMASPTPAVAASLAGRLTRT
jgi:hypothetical protein